MSHVYGQPLSIDKISSIGLLIINECAELCLETERCTETGEWLRCHCEFGKFILQIKPIQF